ncbi:MAG: methylmalonyl Co-A mutase-associated GTPase MeaB [Leptospiraceae bacterium]|nr:methylmalonyl Co-A mutase-associated GTPase MeaB [Leptospiraceae bacterium]MCK6380798.1 methylmalonyl Co-A mutase-associated GTPase MeaB [Leptospiraceae bacterium]NUM42161.1 methylmalonyl Co-A mutase-associated GTPase MeaB [Leptospiraceae bacterium]
MKEKIVSDLLKGILEKNRRVLSKSITLVESTSEKDKNISELLLSNLPLISRATFRIGISGTPGVGKSTFIESFGLYLISQGLQVAVLAVDPSSPITGGSILGDKTRMVNLSNHPNSFIRPSPSGGSLGGVARKTKDVISLCEAFGFDVVLVETVGVGQSEVAVCDITDIFILLLQPGAGDELQGIKKGIMEIADIIAINKSDGKNKISAEITKSEIQSALSFTHPKNSFWKTPVHLISSIENTGLEEVWTDIKDFFEKSKDLIFIKRKEQTEKWFWASIEELIFSKLTEIKTKQESIEILNLYKANVISHQKAIENILSFLKSEI